MTVMKYVRLKEMNQIIIFSNTIVHSTFAHLNPVSAGFIFFDTTKRKAVCYGESFTLGLSSVPEIDSELATRQLLNLGIYE